MWLFSNGAELKEGTVLALSNAAVLGTPSFPMILLSFVLGQRLKLKQMVVGWFLHGFRSGEDNQPNTQTGGKENSMTQQTHPARPNCATTALRQGCQRCLH
jgi:hypothetical protein